MIASDGFKKDFMLSVLEFNWVWSFYPENV
jgi:hypothetical protein